MTVLVLAPDLDLTADCMVALLGERGVEVFRVNTAWFPTQVQVSVELHDARWHGVLTAPHGKLDLDRVQAVWYRSPEAYQMPPELSPAEAHHTRVEAKYGLVGGMAIDEEGVRKNVYTRLLEQEDFTDLRGIEHTTHLFQRWVPKARESRVIVVGQHITAAAITAGSQRGYVDYRTDYDNLRYELVDSPEQVITGIRLLMAGFGLVFGALDFVITPSGGWVFLEINLTGQYGFIEHAIGAPLTAQLADLLTGVTL